MVSGYSNDSNQSGEPQWVQKHLSPLPELNFEILLLALLITTSAVCAIAQAAGEVPENFRQLLQWQYRPECKLPFMIKVTSLHKQDP